MATSYSDQRTKRTAVPSRRVQPNEWGGRVRQAYFSYTVPVGNEAVANVLELVELPAGARILGGFAAWQAMSSGGGDAGIQIGITGTVTKYLGTVSVDAAGTTLFANTIALNYGEELTVDTTLIATVITEAWLAGQKIAGHVLYVLD